MKKIIIVILIVVLCIFSFQNQEGIFACDLSVNDDSNYSNKIFRDSEIEFEKSLEKQEYIKWVDFNVSEAILKEVYYLDLQHYGSKVDFKFINVLAYLTALNGNKFSHADKSNLNKSTYQLENGEKIADLAKNLKYYEHYVECYEAALGGLIGKYHHQGQPEKIEYGLRAYHPIAKGFWYSEYDDFGNARSYGFKRKHLGHDMFGSVGTPVVAVEGGEVTELEWNRYGGWTISIRSKDKKRIYYYAHLRKNRPYASDLKLGDIVEAGKVIGYMGNTGYSLKENTNMDCEPHLHIGLQLIFDESQVRGAGEVWIDLYNIIKLLSFNTASTERNAETKEHSSINLKVPA